MVSGCKANSFTAQARKGFDEKQKMKWVLRKTEKTRENKRKSKESKSKSIFSKKGVDRLWVDGYNEKAEINNFHYKRRNNHVHNNGKE